MMTRADDGDMATVPERMVEVQYACEGAGIPGDAAIRRWVGAVLGDQGAPAELTIRIVDEEEGRALNSAYRGRTNATNVLSFPFEAPPGIHLPILGDIAICAPVVQAEAREQGKVPAAHWAHMVVHGVLHLLGYQHDADADAEEMEALEVAILRELGFPDPYRSPPVGQDAGAALLDYERVPFLTTNR